MKLRARLAVFGLCAAVCVPAAARAIGRFDVDPVVVTFAPGQTSASVEITNVGPAAQEIEVGMKSWTRSDGSDDGEATDDLVVSPSIFIVAPGQTQLVRIGPDRDLSGDIERTYRLVATEVPDTAGQARVETLLRMRLPVFIAPRTIVAAPLIWRVARDDGARITISARNAGNIHRRIRSLRVVSGGHVLFDNLVAAYVLAHQSRAWSVPLKTGDGPLPVEVRATQMDGSTQESAFSVR